MSKATRPAIPERLLAAFGHLTAHPEATWFDLLDNGLMESGALLQPEQLLDFAVDGRRTDLVDEFRQRPLGPHSEELQLLLWRLRARPGESRYVLRRHGDEGWQVVRLVGGRRPVPHLVDDAVFVTAEDCEWAVFALRWRDQTGAELPLRRSA